MMCCRWFALAMAVVFPSTAWAQRPPSSAYPSVAGAPAGITAFIDVNVVPMDTERILPGQTVLVDGGRITALGPVNQVKVPKGAVRIEGRGHYLIPGLGDMHVHLEALVREVGAKTERTLLEWLAHGVTTVRNMDYSGSGGETLLQREKVLLQLRARAAAGELWSPRIYTASSWVRGRVMSWKQVKSDSVAPYLFDYKAMGFDFIKPYEEPALIFDSLMAIGHRLGIPVAGHVPPKVSVERALAGGMKSIEHLTGYHPVNRPDADTTLAGIQALAAATRRSGTWNTPTLMVTHVEGRSADHTRMAGRIVKALQDAGAGLLLGTDNYKTPADELDALVSVGGLTPYQALLTGTRHVAAYFDILEETGTVAVGKRADLVLLTGNPLQDIRHTVEPAGVMLGGRWLPRAAINDRLLQSSGGRDDTVRGVRLPELLKALGVPDTQRTGR